MLWFQLGIWGMVAFAAGFIVWLMRHTYRHARNSVSTVVPMTLVPPRSTDRRRAAAPPWPVPPRTERRGPSALETVELMAELEFERGPHPEPIEPSSDRRALPEAFND